MALLKQDGDGFVFTGGKHKDSTLEDVAESDPSYLVWLYGSDAGSDLPKEAWEALEQVLEDHDIDVD